MKPRLLCACALAACRASGGERPPSVTTAASVAPSVAAAPASATAQAAGSTLPAGARCTGRWSGSLAYAPVRKDGQVRCDDPEVAALGEYEIAVGADATGWHARASNPSGATVGGVELSWDADAPSCSAFVDLTIGAVQRRISLHRAVAGTRAHSTVGRGRDSCVGTGSAAFAPDAAELPPPPPSRAATVGSYTAEISWRHEGQCDKAPAPPDALAFRIELDRRHSDELRATDLAAEYPRSLMALDADGALIVGVAQNAVPDYVTVTMRLRLRAAGAGIIGDAEYELVEPHVRRCVYTGTLRGTRR